jgi:hypothetical protein
MNSTTSRIGRKRPAAIALVPMCLLAPCCIATASAQQTLAVADAASSSRASATLIDVVGLATHWMDAVRKGDRQAVAELTGNPFTLRETGTEGICVSCTSPEGARTAFVLQCLTQDSMLMDELKLNPELLTEVLPRNRLPAWTKRWHRELRPGLAPVLITLFGNGVTVYFVLLVGKGQDGPGVYGLWKHALFDPS